MGGTALFDIQRRTEADTVSRVSISGELDVEAGPPLSHELRRMLTTGSRVLLDLSQVTFIDCSGLTIVLTALRDARQVGCEVEVDKQVSRQVRRIIEITGVRLQIWPGPGNGSTSRLLSASH